jgi:hypothetical protein
MTEFRSPAQATAYANIYLAEHFDDDLLAAGFTPVSTEPEDMQLAVDAFGSPPMPTARDSSVVRTAEYEAALCRTHPVTIYTLVMAIITSSAGHPETPLILLVGTPSRTEQVFYAAERAARSALESRPVTTGRMAIPPLRGWGFLTAVEPGETVLLAAPVPDPDGVEHLVTLNLPDSFRFPGDGSDENSDVVWDLDTGAVTYRDTLVGDALAEVADDRYDGEFTHALAMLNDIDPDGYRAVMAALTLYSETEADPQVTLTGDWSSAMRHMLVAVLGWNVVRAESSDYGESGEPGHHG